MEIKKAIPTSCFKEKNGKKSLYTWTLPTNHEGGHRLYLSDTSGPLRISSGSTQGTYVFFQPFKESDVIWKVHGEGISADHRFQFPDRNKWGVVYKNGGYTWNFKDDIYQDINFDKNSDIIVYVNDVKGEYNDNTGHCRISILTYE